MPPKQIAALRQKYARWTREREFRTEKQEEQFLLACDNFRHHVWSHMLPVEQMATELFERIKADADALHAYRETIENRPGVWAGRNESAA